MDILGLNFSLDSAAALIRDGKVVAASQEERFVRQKHYAGFPSRALEFCLNRGEIGFDDVDAVAFFWNPGIHAEAQVSRFTSSARHHLEFLHNVPVNLLQHFEDNRVSAVDQVFHLESGKKLKIHYITHHLCHAAAAFFTSPFDDAAILTVDGYGERQSTVIAAGEGKVIKTVLSTDFPHSLGAFYAAITQYLGFRANSGEGKVMGLASYGNSDEFVEPIRKMVRLTDQGFELDLSCFEFFHDRPNRFNERLVQKLGKERKPESELTQVHMNIAYALQTVTEETLLHLARLAREKTGKSTLCVAGGVGLNCVANGRLARESGFEKCFFYPSSGDSGTAIGAALWADHVIYDGSRTGEIASEYVGPSYSVQQVTQELDKASVSYREIVQPEQLAAQMIADGLTIGWFQGRAEFGPRALGNRSILANPVEPGMKDLLNSRVKFRESFRPYAPSVLEEECQRFFSSSTPSPYMLRAYDTLEEKRDVLPSITHVDGTARVQTVNKNGNPRYYRLIKELGRLTGVPVVLNTSFNIRGEPIVNTPAEALRCFFSTGLDALFIEDFLVVKDPARLQPYLEKK
jgi:carbamoyltransferase